MYVCACLPVYACLGMFWYVLYDVYDIIWHCMFWYVLCDRYNIVCMVRCISNISKCTP